MKALPLPEEIIRYIYSFDDNLYYRRLYNQSLHEMICIYAKDQVSSHIQHIHTVYRVFSQFNKPTPFYYYFFRISPHWRVQKANMVVYIPRKISIRASCTLAAITYFNSSSSSCGFG